jgi:hypothetical protein
MARPGLTGHRKFRRLARALGSPILARGALELLWDSCYEAGDDYVGTAADIEQAIGWPGESGVLVRALIDAGAPEGVGFLDPAHGVEGAFRVHDLWHHAPDYVAKRRRRELDRQGKVDPETERRPAPNGGQRPVIQDCLDGVGLPPSPSPSHPPSPGAVEEISAEASSASFLVFPIVGSKDAQTWTLTEALLHELAGLFPNLDARAECRKALAWSLAHPQKRKTAKGMRGFLTRWLTRAVDSGRGSPREADRRYEGNSAVRQRYDQWTPAACPHAPPCTTARRCIQRQDIDAQKAAS